MLPRSLCLVVLLSSCLAGVGCDNGSTPTAPTPPVATPPPAPTPPPPAPTPPPEPAAIESLTLSSDTVRSQVRAVATVTLTAAAPAGGAVIVLQTGNPEIARVPSGVTIQAGSTTGTFVVETSTVSSLSIVTLLATYQGVTRTAALTVQPPMLEAKFNVSSPSVGSGGCSIINAGGTVDCVLDGGSSDGFPVRFFWTFKVGSNEMTVTGESDVVTPSTSCGFIGGATLNSDGKVPMTVLLQVEDRGGNKSSTTEKVVPVTHVNRCGY